MSDQETCPTELPNWCAQRHWAIFWLLIICSVATVAGRVMVVQNHRAKSDTPFFSANDRSRWATIRMLGDENRYEIDDLMDIQDPVQWNTIDKVRHVGADGQQHFYSSKPPLFPTVVAWKYKALKAITGWEIKTETLLVVRALLLLINVIPWAIYLWFVARMINSVPVRDWARYYLMACAGFGTYLTAFTITLNNHLPAAICVMISLYLLSEIWRKKDIHWSYFLTAGLISALAVNFELPAAAFFACAGLICLIRSFSKTALAFVPGAALVGAAFFAANFAAHGQWQPAYSQRSDGDVMATVTGDLVSDLDKGTLPTEIRSKASQFLEMKLPKVEIGAWPSTPSDTQRWVVRDQVSSNQFAITSTDGKEFKLHQWQNWYDYPGSYWLSTNDARKSEVDRGQESVELYLFHALFGHHGIFSLTPIFLLSLAGMFALLFGAKMGGQFQMRWLGLMGLALTFVVIAFYMRRPEMDRNYGGVSCVLRWSLWLTPIWLISMLPVVDWLARSRTGKAICYALLFISVTSAMYPLYNPWVHPWLYEIWDLTGLPK